MTGEPEGLCLGVVQQTLNVCNHYTLPVYQIEGDWCNSLVPCSYLDGFPLSPDIEFNGSDPCGDA